MRQRLRPGCAARRTSQGLIGEYTSVAVASDGTIWVAGYNDADVTNGLLYGDLVVGKYDTGKQAVQWQDVDGLPPPPHRRVVPAERSRHVARRR